MTNIANAAKAMIAVVAHPSTLSTGELVRWPITFFELVNNTTKAINGGARMPFSTADQNSIFTALIPM